MSVGLSVTVVNLGKTTELIEMPFGLWTRVGRRNHMLAYMGVYEKGHFSGGGVGSRSLLSVGIGPTVRVRRRCGLFTARRNARIASAVLAIQQFRPS